MLEIKPLSTNKIISCTVPIEINKLQEKRISYIFI